MATPLFANTISGGVPRRALLFMPLGFLGLVSVYSATQRPDVPIRNEKGTGPELTIALFAPDGTRLPDAKVRKVVKTESEWKAILAGDEYAVSRRKGTEPPFSGRYAKSHDVGLYHCVGCGTVLFRSQEKFDSGTGWPSFWAPAAESNVAFRKDYSMVIERIEVMCARCDGHLGHVFNDGPAPTGLRYCMNSVALRFQPAA